MRNSGEQKIRIHYEFLRKKNEKLKSGKFLYYWCEREKK